MIKPYDVVIIGSGPNGLSAGIFLAEKGLKVLILEAAETIGGGMRTKELTLKGFHHDVCSAVHPMGALSPFFKQYDLKKYGLEWIYPEISVAHPLDGEESVLLSRSIEETAYGLGIDAKAYTHLMEPFLGHENRLFEDILKPLGLPKNPLLFLRFGMKAFLSATTFTNLFFKGKRAKALFAGCAAHSTLPFDKYFTAAMGMMFLISGHAVNWPLPKGGSQALSNALAGLFQALGGEILCNTKVENFNQLPEAKTYLFDTDPFQMADIAGEQLPKSYKNRLKRFNFGTGVFKIDYALNAPIPWNDPHCLKASTVHIGGTIEEISQAEKETWQGKHAEKPYVLLSQQSQFDPSRSPKGQHTCWAYCHVPFGSTEDMSGIIENQIERFASGFKDTIIAKSSMSPLQFHRYNPNYVGGSINGGANDMTQLFTRPVFRLDPYSTPNEKIFICSASTPPGGGVHGMCGYHAARSVYKKFAF